MALKRLTVILGSLGASPHSLEICINKWITLAKGNYYLVVCSKCQLACNSHLNPSAFTKDWVYNALIITW